MHKCSNQVRFIVSLILVLALLFSMPLSAAASVLPLTEGAATAAGDITDANRDAAQDSLAGENQSGRPSGLVGFEDDYDLQLAGDTVSIIVEFAHQPAQLEQAIRETLEIEDPDFDFEAADQDVYKRQSGGCS